ncbi:MAG: class A beta-lactamase-related serine hydrolase [Gammaproteobacteria bacterium TMED182]|nr:hypothetical protein [Gammaproteobacteria bacterium]RPG47390.1 MAG: class A beta-lactamase-related serine hydrolase [Gammaproteobacteria bacterium TMED182]
MLNTIRNITWALAATFTLITGSATADELVRVAPEQQGMSSERLRRLDDLAAKYVAEGQVAGIQLQVNRGGQLVYSSSVGHRSVAARQALETDDLFRIYSMTKPITAVALMQLYEAGHFHLSDPITKWLPELEALQVRLPDGQLVPVNRSPTMAELLTHTAGFSYGFYPKDPIDQAYREAGLWGSEDLDAFVLKIAKLPLAFQPGKDWRYSIAVDLTGLIIERMSGQSLDVFFKQSLFEPLGMTDTFFEVPADKRHRLVTNHYWDWSQNQLAEVVGTVPTLGIESEEDAMSGFDRVTLFTGGAGLVSTMRDYMRFAEMLRAGGVLDDVRVIGPKTLKFMTKNHLPKNLASTGSGEDPIQNRFKSFGFGLGFGVMMDPVGSGVLSSRGSFSWGGAAGTIFWIDPGEDIAAVAMIQLMGSPWPLRNDFALGVYQALTESYE